MLGSTLKDRFKFVAMNSMRAEKIKCLSYDQDLEITVKSGASFGKHKDGDWIVFTLNTMSPPEPEWFEKMIAREYESEREVETYFVAPLLEELGYNYDDIFIGCPVEIPVGKKSTKTEADFVVFNGSGREKNNVLMVVEAKKTDILKKDICQAWSYAKELFPACFIVTNGNRIIVFKVNNMKAPDLLMDFDKSMLRENWRKLYRCVCKKSTIKARFKAGSAL